MRLPALSLVLVALGCSGGSASKPAASASTAASATSGPVSCRQYLQHVAEIDGGTARDLPLTEAALLDSEPPKFFEQRCAEASYRAYFEALPAEHVACMMAAIGTEQAQRCIDALVDRRLAEQEARRQAPPAGCPTGASPSGTVTIQGTVRDAAQAPALGVTVVLKPRDGEASTQLTDEQGRYVFQAQPAGYYALDAFDETREVVSSCRAVAQSATIDLVMAENLDLDRSVIIRLGKH